MLQLQKKLLVLEIHSLICCPVIRNIKIFRMKSPN
ncbi:hypothetical protein X975_18395, partial [Stegodyphus mimosarum]